MQPRRLTSFNFWYFVIFTVALYLPLLLLIVSVLYLPDGIAGYDWKRLWRRLTGRRRPAEQTHE